MTRVLFMGTPDYAVPSLEALSERYEVVLIVTQPDRKQGRGRKLQAPPTKLAAQRLGLPVWQPTTLRTRAAFDRLRNASADVYVTAAIGFILPPEVLALPTRGCLNLHASLLPRWRGAAPVSAAILHGDTETGVTLMQTDAGLDTGPIVAQVHCAIQDDDTTETLTGRLAVLGARMLIETLPDWIAGKIAPRPQPTEGVTLSSRLTKQDARIDWQQPALHIERMVRAYTPWPGAFTTYRGQPLKVLQAQALPDWRGDEPLGTVISLSSETVAVATGQGALILCEIQLAGKRAQEPAVFCCGYQDFVGAVLI